MESLVPVVSGGPDLIVGVSGFGSAKIDGHRWRDAGVLTGRTVYHLVYDAQEFPWDESDRPGVLDLATSAPVLRRLWGAAREGGRVASRHLEGWLRRWSQSRRRVLLVGFSLGSQVVVDALQGLSEEEAELVEAVFVSGAVIDTDPAVDRLANLSRAINVWSSKDAVLRWLYPVAAGSVRGKAIGLGPLRDHLSVDLTDMIGPDHLWAGVNLPRILRIVLGVDWSSSPKLPVLRGGKVDAASVERLSSWAFLVPEVADLLEDGLSGRLDEALLRRLSGYDSWAASPQRFLSILEGASSVRSVGFSSRAVESADRSRVQIEGLIRRWMGSDLEPLRASVEERGRSASGRSGRSE